VIVVDTHVWIWWVHQDDRLTPQAKDFITHHEPGRIGVSAISCWEVATLVERGRLRLPMAVDQWLHAALAYPGMKLLPDLSPGDPAAPRGLAVPHAATSADAQRRHLSTRLFPRTSRAGSPGGKRPGANGVVELSPFEFLDRLADLVPAAATSG
jgi:PIN domain nuclease of toxin-antitoxin system